MIEIIIYYMKISFHNIHPNTLASNRRYKILSEESAFCSIAFDNQ